MQQYSCIYKWKVPPKYNQLKKAFIVKQNELTQKEISAFLNAILKMNVDDHEESLMSYIANKYQKQIFPNQDEVFNGKEVQHYFKAELIQDFVEREAKIIYQHLIDYYDIRSDIDDKMYKWITNGKTALFGFTLDAYLLSIQDIDRFLEVTETECESDSDLALQELEDEFDQFKQKKQQSQNQTDNNLNNSGNENKKKDEL